MSPSDSDSDTPTRLVTAVATRLGSPNRSPAANAGTPHPEATVTRQCRALIHAQPYPSGLGRAQTSGNARDPARRAPAGAPTRPHPTDRFFPAERAHAPLPAWSRGAVVQRAPLCPDAPILWTSVVRPTLHEVLGPHAAMSLATSALRLANRLLE